MKEVWKQFPVPMLLIGMSFLNFWPVIGLAMIAVASVTMMVRGI